MPFKLGPMELVLILGIIVILFGIGKLPDAVSSIVKAVKSFRKQL
jgi:sec-independent protein translocase protein TatA